MDIGSKIATIVFGAEFISGEERGKGKQPGKGPQELSTVLLMLSAF